MFQTYLEKSGLDRKPHQVDCVNWCLKNERQGNSAAGVIIKGGLIADEMGLGKTIQMLGLVVSNFLPRTLIVLPRALLDQWEDVIIRTLGHVPLVFHGKGASKLTEEFVASHPIVLTTYGMVTIGKNKDDTLLHKIRWNRLIFDEAHHLRNKRTRVHTSTLKLRCSIRWLMTGTPIQNKKSDFYSLCAAMGIPVEYYTKTENLMQLVSKFIIKRTKSQAGINLPELKLNSVKIDWDSEPEKLMAEEAHSLLSFNNLSNNLVNPSKWGNSYISVLLRARQICIYPALIKKHMDLMVSTGVTEDSDGLLEALSSSSKIDTVVNTIIERKDNNKAKLVFCQYRGEIDIIRDDLTRAGFNVKTFDGRTSAYKRHEILTEKCDVLILQIKTACEGLNLQHFTEVYLVSPYWNPSVEDQAIGRCHRIGQTEPVHVYRFSMGGFGDGDSSEEGISADMYSTRVQEKKRIIMKMIDECEHIASQ